MDTCKTTCSFPKAARLLKRRHFYGVMHSSMRISCSHIVIHYRFSRAAIPRLGITVSKKHGKAHDRNRFKRVVREAFRQCQMQLPPNVDLNILPISRQRPCTPYILTDFFYFIEKLKEKSPRKEP